MVSDDELKATILHRLARKRKWGASHTAFENVMKGVPSHIKGKMKEIGEQLVRDGLLVPKPTGYGLHVSLNTKKSEEIKQLIRKYFREEML